MKNLINCIISILIIFALSFNLKADDKVIGNTLILDFKKDSTISIKNYIRDNPDIEEIYFMNFKNLNIPNEINNLKNLNTINFIDNRNLALKNIFKILSGNKNLENLNFWGNNIDSIPKEIDLLSNLNQLDIRNEKKIVSFSKEAAKTCKIKNIIIGDHDLLSLPKNFEKYEFIESVDLSQISKFDIKKTFILLSKMKGLKRLRFSNFNTESILSQVYLLDNVQKLSISNLNNEILSPVFLNMKSLKCLDISYSNIKELDKKYYITDKKLTIALLIDPIIVEKLKKKLSKTNIKILRFPELDFDNCY